MAIVKKSLIMFSICILLFSIAGCKSNSTLEQQTQLESPPELLILCENASIVAKTGTYSWTIDHGDGTGTGIEADSSAAPELVKDSIPLTVSPKSSLTLRFKNEPAAFTVNLWQGDQSIKQPIADNMIVVPETKGNAVYEVIGNWDQGTVYYAFLVNVD